MRRALSLAAAAAALATAAGQATRTPTPTASSGQTSGRFACDSILALVVGSGNATINTAQILYIEERQRITGALLRRFPLRYIGNGPTEPACTLAVAGPEAASDFWLYDMDGMPALSGDGTLATVVCFNLDAGSLMSMDVPKTIASVHYDGTVTYTYGLSDTYYGIFGPAGVRQAVTVDGSEFWLSGMSNAFYGFRYASSPTSTSTIPIFDPDNMFLPGYSDARGIGIIDGSLYVSTTNLDPPQYQGIVKVEGGLPRTTEASPSLSVIPTCTVNTFWFESPTSVWVAANTPIFSVGALAHYTYSGSAWSLERNVTLETVNPVYSITGRMEITGFNLEEFVVYASSPTKVYRYVPRTGALSVTYNILDYYARYTASVRGVVLAPRALDACSPTPTASTTATGSSTATRSSSSTQTSSASQTATASSSNTGTPSHSQTRTPSHSQTSTPSHSQTSTSSHSQTATPSHSQTSTSSHSQTSTSSSSQTQTSTPSSSQTRTASSSQTATSSSSQTSTSSESQTATASSSQTSTASSTSSMTASTTASNTMTSSMTASMTMTSSMTPSTTATPTMLPSCPLQCCDLRQHRICCRGRREGHGVCPHDDGSASPSPSASASPGFQQKCCACDCSCGYMLKPKAISETAARKEAWFEDIHGNRFDEHGRRLYPDGSVDEVEGVATPDGEVEMLHAFYGTMGVKNSEAIAQETDETKDHHHDHFGGHHHGGGHDDDDGGEL